jgi:hypothetical protein
MLEAYVEIIGTRPLLFNRFGPDSIPLVKAERTGVAGNDPEEWTRRICWNEKRQLYLEAPAVFASIRDGGIYTKKGRGSIQPLIVATLQVEFDSDRPLPSGRLGAERPVRPCLSLDARGVRMARGPRNVRYRLAASPGWTAIFHLTWDKTVLSRRELHAACIDAGRYAGIGDGRKIGFGRYDVAKFEVMNDAQEAAAS